MALLAAALPMLGQVLGAESKSRSAREDIAQRGREQEASADLQKLLQQRQFQEAYLQRLAVEREAEAQRRYGSEESQLGREFTSGEAEKGRGFTAEQAQLGREFTSGEAEKGRTYGAEQAQLGRQFTAEEAARGRGFTAEQAQLGRGFEAEQSQLGREFTSGEAEKGRGFTAEQQKLGREFTAEESEKGRALTREQFEARKKAYEDTLARAGGMAERGEQQLLSETERAPAELEQVRRDIQAGTAEDIQKAGRETRAGLEQAGVRGGQAATILGRTVGGIRERSLRDVNKMAYDDAIRRQQQRAGLYGQKAAAGTSTLMSGGGF